MGSGVRKQGVERIGRTRGANQHHQQQQQQRQQQQRQQQQQQRPRPNLQRPPPFTTKQHRRLPFLLRHRQQLRLWLRLPKRPSTAILITTSISIPVPIPIPITPSISILEARTRTPLQPEVPPVYPESLRFSLGCLLP